MKKNKFTKCKTLDQERKSIEYLIKKKKIIENEIKINENLIKINQVLKDNDLFSVFPNALSKLVEIKHPYIKNGEPFIIETPVTLHSTEVEQLAKNIQRPTKEQIQEIYDDFRFKVAYVTIPLSDDKSVQIPNNSKKQDDTIFPDELLEVYHKKELGLVYFNIKQKYIRNLSKQEVYEHYKKNIDRLNKELEQINKLILLIQERNSVSQLSLLQSPSHLYSGTQGLEKKEKLAKVFNGNIDFNTTDLSSLRLV